MFRRESDAGGFMAKGIREALDFIVQSRIKVSVPLPRTRKPIQEVLCAKLEKLRRRSLNTGSRMRNLRVRPDTMSPKLPVW
jgi:hypothetical protein